jgi:hypothetical protein
MTDDPTDSTQKLVALVLHAMGEYSREDLPEDGRSEQQTIADAVIAAGWRPAAGIDFDNLTGNGPER